MESVAGEVTQLLRSAQAGDQAAAQMLFPKVYEQLRQLAQQRMAGERRDHTLQATALVHEVFLRLCGNAEAASLDWTNRAHFFYAAAEAMRRILIDHARAHGSAKRGGRKKRVELESVLDLAREQDIDEIMALDEALARLDKVSPIVAKVVRLRFYAGLSVEETGRALGISESTVKREWTFARAWLYRDLGGENRRGQTG